jgi:hypothetical protein
VTERMQHGTSTAFVDVQLGHVLGLEAADLEAVFYGAVLKDVGCGVSGVVLARSSLARAGPSGSTTAARTGDPQDAPVTPAFWARTRCGRSGGSGVY